MPMTKINPPLEKVLGKNFEPSSLIDLKFGRYDLTIKTDEQGRAIMFFIGTRAANGEIRGDRFSRRLKLDRVGATIKDHWEQKGKATPFRKR